MSIWITDTQYFHIQITSYIGYMHCSYHRPPILPQRDFSEFGIFAWHKFRELPRVNHDWIRDVSRRHLDRQCELFLFRAVGADTATVSWVSSLSIQGEPL